MGKNPYYSGSVLFGFCDYQGSVWFGFYNHQCSVVFGSKMSVFLHCKIAYTTEENVCFAWLNRIMYWNHVMSTLLQSSPLILHKSCLPVQFNSQTSSVMSRLSPSVNQLEQTTQSKLEMGKNPHCSGSVLFGFFSFFLYLSSSSVRFFEHWGS